MTARDRSQLRDRLATALAKSAPKPISFDALAKHIEREVDRAVRAERAAFRDTEELRAAHLRHIDEQMIERTRKGKAR